MARPSKPIEGCTGARTNAEKERRKENEKKLRGDNDKLKPPSYLTKEAKKIFKWIVKESKEGKLFGNVDVFILEQFSNTYARYRELEMEYNYEKDRDIKKELRKELKRETDQLPRLYNELGLSPSTRAKLGSLNLKKEEDENDPVLQLLAEMNRC